MKSTENILFKLNFRKFNQLESEGFESDGFALANPHHHNEFEVSKYPSKRIINLIPTENILFKLVTISMIILFLASSSSAFIGEAAAVKVLLDFLLRINLNKIGEDLVVSAMNLCRDHFVKILLLNPDSMNPGVLGITKYIISIMQPIFVFAIIFSGIYMIFFSGSPGTRAKIKSLLPGIIIAMVLVTISPHIMSVIFSFSETLSDGVISHGPKEPMTVLLPMDEDINPINYLMSRFQNITWYSAEASVPFLFLSLILLAALLMVIFARYIVVALFTIIFPLTIFLYLFIPTRWIGKRMMEQTLLWIFVQVIEAIALISVVTIIIAFSSLLVKEALLLLALGGILTLILAPIATVSFLRDFLPG